jgi:hypothetical protein
MKEVPRKSRLSKGSGRGKREEKRMNTIFEVNEVNDCWESMFPVVYDEDIYFIVKLGARRFYGMTQWDMGSGRKNSGYAPFFADGKSVGAVLSALESHWD